MSVHVFLEELVVLSLAESAPRHIDGVGNLRLARGPSRVLVNHRRWQFIDIVVQYLLAISACNRVLVLIDRAEEARRALLHIQHAHVARRLSYQPALLFLLRGRAQDAVFVVCARVV